MGRFGLGAHDERGVRVGAAVCRSGVGGVHGGLVGRVVVAGARSAGVGGNDCVQGIGFSGGRVVVEDAGVDRAVAVTSRGGDVRSGVRAKGRSRVVEDVAQVVFEILLDRVDSGAVVRFGDVFGVGHAGVDEDVGVEVGGLVVRVTDIDRVTSRSAGSRGHGGRCGKCDCRYSEHGEQLTEVTLPSNQGIDHDFFLLFVESAPEGDGYYYA